MSTIKKLTDARDEAIESFIRMMEEDPHVPVQHFDKLLTEMVGKALDIVVDDHGIGDMVYPTGDEDPNAGPKLVRIDLKGQFFAAVNT